MSKQRLWSDEERSAKVRDLFDTSNRVQFATLMREHAANPHIALQSADTVRQVFFQEAEKHWDSWVQEASTLSDGELQRALAVFKEQEATLGGEPPKTLFDVLQDHGVFPAGNRGWQGTGPGRGEAVAPTDALRQTTRSLMKAVVLDVWPSNATLTDFGIESQKHYEALYYPIRQGEIRPEQLDAANGNGAKLTELVRASPSNPHKDVVFRTSWDEVFCRDPGHAAQASDTKGLVEEIFSSEPNRPQEESGNDQDQRARGRSLPDEQHQPDKGRKR